ncbi:LLM class flavin-dependent oxidoreductase [Pseudooceanicola sp. CBS1P-1]|uniref:NtaA/DmoA family FMN-dependent monooxygenase n=1 Tax=Pseudooceanicola albus TaxID=2692189 RepID=A0A6L7GAR7_9RHOB|nr:MULTISPECIES: LLM class flavin-dependent oxidoreductase [Pseudooceanicola]MBT9386571.1 LLM class flavin-dependent oxidoreductase [Pseudooceanicola endophyticus]MXN20687.1 NtaA/DmoA family FMN-dependent monooxygenase [Pseudooceanicola albus]
MTKTRKMHFGLSVAHLGYHPAAWRMPDVPVDGTMNLQHYVNCAKIAERGKLDFLFFADVSGVRQFGDARAPRHREQQQSKHEPFTLIAALAALTEEIGFVGTASTTFQHPYNLTRRLATLDHLSGGRAAWNMVTSWSEDEAENFGLATTGTSDERHARAHEFVSVVKRLCDTWEDGAFVQDKESGIFFDREKLHFLDHEGDQFRIKGPLDLPRPPQGVPPIATAGASENAQELAAAHADIVYAGQPNIELARAYYASLKAKTWKYGRTPDDVKIMPGIMTFVAPTRAEAQAKLDRLNACIDPVMGFGHMLVSGLPDLSACPLDSLVPEADSELVAYPTGQPSGFAMSLMKRARADGKTVRQLMEMVLGGDLWQLGIVGTPTDVADKLEEWFSTGAADGFNVQAAYLPGAAEDFVELVVPELQRRGLFRTEYEGRTLRDRLGIARPQNSFTLSETAARVGTLATR